MVERFIQFRRWLHQHPQTSGKEKQTTQKIIQLALQLGVPKQSIKTITKRTATGLWIDLNGQAPSKGRDFCVAIRADIDALQMDEVNDCIQYKSTKKGAAHMCGHDGHTATLAALIPLFLNEAKNIPCNKKVRLLFQPAQECQNKLLGAYLMIEQGCLEGVNEIYGFHNHNINFLPNSFGFLSCKQGIMMSKSTIIKIKIVKKQQECYHKQDQNHSLIAAIQFYRKMMSFATELKEARKTLLQQFTLMFPLLKSGQSPMGFSPTAKIEGTLRTFQPEICTILLQKIQQQTQSLKLHFDVQLSIEQGQLTVNHKTETDHIVRLAKEHFGQNKVGEFGLPTKGSEDFGKYLETTPGAFFFVCGADAEHQGYCHNPSYNFNDKLIEPVSSFWLKLLKDRFKDQISQK